MNRLLIILLVSLSFSMLNGQTTQQKAQKVEALNEYVHFTNEGIHGMLIVHRLLENYNQEINKYVDLDSYVINNFSNKDLPSNIFEDTENWFYDESPYDWRNTVSKNNSLVANTKGQLQGKLKEMTVVLDAINQIRFDLESLIGTLDLTQKTEQEKVYQKLEQAVKHYESYYELQQSMQLTLVNSFNNYRPNSDEIKYPAFYNSLSNLYLSQKNILVALRNKEDENFDRKLSAFESAINNLDNLDISIISSSKVDRRFKRYLANIKEQSTMALKSAQKYYNTADVPEEYKQYGKFYFYYNSDIINKFNRYGNGIVFEMNNILDHLDLPVMRYSELPHYFKVIYPKKLKKVDYIAATDNKITSLPSQLKDRDITLSKHKIKVDSLAFTVEFYDHMIEDGDIISLSFNGDWILEQMPLLAKPKVIKLKINEEGKNYFLLHAENVGRRPPNTMAIRYTYRGREKQIILKSDLNTSEMIEIIYAP